MTFERQLPLNSVLSVGYVGHRGLHRLGGIRHQPAGSPAALVIPDGATKPFGLIEGFSAIQQEESVANSMYNSLQVSWNRRFANGGSFGSRLCPFEEHGRQLQLPRHRSRILQHEQLWGPSEFDTRHAVTITYSLRSAVLQESAESWRVRSPEAGRFTGIAQFQTGTPCGVGTNNDFAGVGSVGSFGCGTEGQFWVVNGTAARNRAADSAILPAHWQRQLTQVLCDHDASGTADLHSTGSGHIQPAANVRDTFYQPGFQNWNLGLFKKFPINEQMGFEFRAEAYNFINHPNWGTVQFNPTSATFGEVTSKSTSNPRNLQLSLRFFF